MWPALLDRSAPRLSDAFDPVEANVISRVITRMMHDGIAIQDPTGRIVYCNDKAAELLRMAPQDLLDRSSMDARWDTVTLDGDPYPGERHPSMQAVLSGADVRGEVMGVRCGDSTLRWLSIDSSPLDVPSGHYSLTVFTDITAALEGHRRLQRTRAEIQGQLIQHDLPSTDRVRFTAAYRASGDARTVGGDFYGAYPLAVAPGVDDLAFFIGDVCGHGVLSAGLSGTARNTVRALAPVLDDPSDVIARLHEVVQDERPDSFLTSVYGRLTIDAADAATVRLCCAGHPHPLLVRDGAVEPLGDTGLLVGMVPNGPRPVATTSLQRGDRVLLFTDGVFDDAMPRRSACDLAAELPAGGSLDEIVAWMMDLAAARPERDASHADDAAVLGFELR